MRAKTAYDPVAQGIRVIARAKGLMYMGIAERAGYTQVQMSDMINGRRVIRAKDLPRLAKAMGVSVQDIFDASNIETEGETA